LDPSYNAEVWRHYVSTKVKRNLYSASR